MKSHRSPQFHRGFTLYELLSYWAAGAMFAVPGSFTPTNVSNLKQASTAVHIYDDWM